MATLSPTVTLKLPKTGRGAGDAPPPSGGGGGGDHGSSGSPDYHERLRRARLGILVAMVAVVMLFIACTSAYIFRRGLPTFDESRGQYVRDWFSVSLPMGLLFINTALLILSSITMELARRQIARQVALAPVRMIPGVSLGDERRIPWLNLTALLGVAFLVGQFLAWQQLEARGFYVSTNPSSSFVYLLTGMHAVHLAGGIVALLYASMTALLHKPLEARRIAVDVTAWYWHFMAVLWIYIFALLAIAR
jgi:cytochrome c oxidase subunit 3